MESFSRSPSCQPTPAIPTIHSHRNPKSHYSRPRSYSHSHVSHSHLHSQLHSQLHSHSTSSNQVKTNGRPNNNVSNELFTKSKPFLKPNTLNVNNNSSMKPKTLTPTSPGNNNDSSSTSTRTDCHFLKALSKCFPFCSKPKDYSEYNKQGTEMDDGTTVGFEMSQNSEILTINDANSLGNQLPPIAIGNTWKLSFSTTTDGFCLHSLYRKMRSVDSPVLLIIQDTRNRVFGVCASNALRISEHFYGTSQSFLFRFAPNLQVFKWNGDNFYFIKGNYDSISFGSGNGKAGLWLDGDLNKGRTENCQTFGSPSLVPEEDFIVKTVECWTFGR